MSVPVDDEYEFIWLAPACDSRDEEGRVWCEDNVWDAECGCGGRHKAVKYARVRD